LETGSHIQFGRYRWQVLEVQSPFILIITESIISLRWYHDTFSAVTWEESTLRRFLNEKFFHSFSSEEQERIRSVKNVNHANPWFKTTGGGDTLDYVFLLSLEEVCRYFGDSTSKLSDRGAQRWMIDDENNERRIAKYRGEAQWWRLRSPGYYSKTAASVTAKGQVYVRGNGVFGTPKNAGGLRPALWIEI